MLHDLMPNIVWAPHIGEELRVEPWRKFQLDLGRDAVNSLKAVLGSMSHLDKSFLFFSGRSNWDGNTKEADLDWSKEGCAEL